MTQYAQPFRLALLALIAVAVISGCAETTRPQATGKGKIRGINAVVTAPELAFLVEERNQGNVNYRDVLGFKAWDDLSYTFNFDILMPGATTRDRIASQFIDVVADTEYTLVLTGTLDNPTILTWEAPDRDWDGTETVFEADFVNLSPQLGPVDVYYAVEGTPPVPGNEIGTLDFGDRVPYQEFPAGDYELIVTPPGDPATILFQSSALSRSGATRVTIALFDKDSSIVSGIGVNIISASGTSQSLADVNLPAQLRTYHAAFGTENFDAFLNNDFNNVVYPNVGFGALSDFADITEIETPVTFTSVGNAGAIIHEDSVQLVPNSHRTLVLFGEPGTLFTRMLLHDARPLETFPVVRITDLASNIDVLNVYDVESGTVIDDQVTPRFGGLVPGVSTAYYGATAGSRDFVITLPGEKTPIASTVTLDLANGNIVDMVIVDTVDPQTVELRILEANF